MILKALGFAIFVLAGPAANECSFSIGFVRRLWREVFLK